LDDTTRLFLTQQQYANDQYNYINNLVALKNLAATLNVNDLEQINAWLNKREQVAYQKAPKVVPHKLNIKEFKYERPDL